LKRYALALATYVTVITAWPRDLIFDFLTSAFHHCSYEYRQEYFVTMNFLWLPVWL